MIEKVYWIEDKEKNGEVYCNSYDFKFCLKCFKPNKKIEVWIRTFQTDGYQKQFATENEAWFEYRVLKGLTYFQLLHHVKTSYEPIP